MRKDFRKSSAEELTITVKDAHTNKAKQIAASKIISIEEGNDGCPLIIYTPDDNSLAIQQFSAEGTVTELVNKLNGALSHKEAEALKKEIIQSRQSKAQKTQQTVDKNIDEEIAQVRIEKEKQISFCSDSIEESMEKIKKAVKEIEDKKSASLMWRPFSKNPDVYYVKNSKGEKIEVDVSDIDQTIKNLERLDNLYGSGRVVEYPDIVKDIVAAGSRVNQDNEFIKRFSETYDERIEDLQAGRAKRKENAMQEALDPEFSSKDQIVLKGKMTKIKNAHKEKYGVNFVQQSNGRFENQVSIDAQKAAVEMQRQANRTGGVDEMVLV